MYLLYVLIALLLAIPTYGVSILVGIILMPAFHNFIVKSKTRQLVAKAVKLPNITIVDSKLSYTAFKSHLLREVNEKNDYTIYDGNDSVKYEDHGDFIIVTFYQNGSLYKTIKFEEQNNKLTAICIQK